MTTERIPARRRRPFATFALALVGLVALAGAARADCEASEPLYRKGEYGQYIDDLKKRAQGGDAGCMFQLGKMLRDGVITKMDLNAARDWYLKAAAQNHAFAQFELGTMYDNGQGVPQDYAEAARWYTKSADQGFAMALRNLGVLYDDGLGVPRDKAKAQALFDKAEEAQNGVEWLPK
jgi:TPR repeat protein